MNKEKEAVMDLLGTLGLSPLGALSVGLAGLAAAVAIAVWTASRRSRHETRTVIRLND